MLPIAFCGDDCNACPRYIATQSGDMEKLKEAAALWKQAGWRDTILPPEKMVCNGCASVEWCRYDESRKCAQDRGYDNCGKCENYPCEKMEKVFKQTELYANECKENLSNDDYERFYEAFFSKRQKINSIHEEYFSQRKGKTSI